MNLQSREDLVRSLRSKKFRDTFISSRISNTLALQIRAMRQERGWSQAHLAELLGTSQNAIYRLESPQYGKPSITTLKRLASIFDVGLAVWFTPFSKLVDRVISLETVDIVVPSFDDDPGIHAGLAASGQVQINTAHATDTMSMATTPVKIETRRKPISLIHQNLELDFGQTILNRDEIRVQPPQYAEATSQGELKDGGKAAA
jgi:transcriptional regulator with XRE-family HTH domain